MIAAEADVVLLQLDGPEWSVQLAVLVFSVSVNTTHHSQQNDHYYDNDG